MTANNFRTVPVPLDFRLFKNSLFFSTLPRALLDDMSCYFRLELWDRNSCIDSQQFLDRFFLLQSGRVELIRINPDTGRSITLDLLSSGEGFDILSLLDGKPHDAIFIPLEDVKVVSLPIEKMREWIWMHPKLNQQLMPYLAKKMREQEDNTVNFALYDTVTRLSRIILKNITKIKTYTGIEQDEHKRHLVNGLSDEVLARMIGSVRQVVNQHLQHWKKQGLINKERNEILIHNLQAIINQASYNQK